MTGGRISGVWEGVEGGNQALLFMNMMMMVLLSSVEIETTPFMAGGGVLEGGKGKPSFASHAALQEKKPAL